MLILYLFLELFAKFTKKELKDVKTVGILFLPILGIGDLVMLSPIIQQIKKIFPSSKILLITWAPNLIEFQDIEFVNHTDFKKNKTKFDLLISPTLNLRHIRFIFSARYWIGYFTKAKLQSNFKAKYFRYDLRNEHYIWRGIYLLKALDEQLGKEMENKVKNKEISYPLISCEKPLYYEQEKLDKNRYLAVAIFSKWEDRQWSLKKYAQVIKNIYQRDYVDKIVLLGDASAQNKGMAKKLIKNIQLPMEVVLDTTGKNSLQNTSYIIKNSTLFLGADSGPSHIAYLLAPRSVVLFVTVDPVLRVPLTAPAKRLIKSVYPDPPPKQSLYNGLAPVPLQITRKYLEGIKVDNVLEQVDLIMKNCL